MYDWALELVLYCLPIPIIIVASYHATDGHMYRMHSWQSCSTRILFLY